MSSTKAASAFLLFLASASSFAAGGAPPSLERLDAAANLLMAASDGNAPGKVCGIQPKDALAMIERLHAMIDEETSNYIAGWKQGLHPLDRPGWKTGCKAACHCGLYSTILRKAGKDSAELDALASDQPIQSCVKRAQWFCKSDLLRSLRRKAPGE